MFSGGFVSPAPLTLICNWTISPTTASKLLNTAVTFSESANATSFPVNAINAPSKTAMGIRGPYIDISINHQPCPPTSRYRHGVWPCVHQVARALPRPSSTAKATLLDVGSFDLPFPLRLRRSAHSYRATFLIRPCPLPLLHRPIFSGAILLEQRKASDFLRLLRRFRGRAMAKACRFRGRREQVKAVRLHLTVPVFAFSRLETGRGKVGCLVVVSIVAARSLLGIDPSSFPLFDPDRGRIRFVIVDFVIAAVRPFVVAATGSAAAAAVAVAVPGFADLAGIADSAGFVCPSAQAMARARAVAGVASCFLVPRSSSSRNRSCPSPLYFSVRA